MKFSKRLWALAAVSLIMTAWGGISVCLAVNPQFRHHALVDSISAESMMDGSSIIVNLTNTQAAPPSEPNIQAAYRAIVIVPADRVIKPQILEVKGLNYQRDKITDAKPFLYSLDEGLTTTTLDLERFASYHYVGRFRNFHLGVISVDYLSKAKTGNEQFMFQSARIKLAFDRLPAPRPELGDSLPALDRQVLEAMTINAADWAVLQAPPRPLKDVEPKIQWIKRVNSSAMPVVKMRVYEEGIYAITGDQIRDAGVDPALYRADLLHLYHRGEPVPIQILNAAQTLRRNSSVVFYCPPLNRLSEPWAEFFLMEGPGDPAPPRLESLAAVMNRNSKSIDEGSDEDAMIEDTNPENPSSLTITQNFFEHGDYFPGMPAGAPNGMWHTTTLHYLKPREFEFTINHPDKDGRAKFTFYARQYQPRDTTSIEYHINGQLVATQDAQGLNVITTNADVSASILRHGINKLGIVMPERDTPSQSPQCIFIGYTVEYPRSAEIGAGDQVIGTILGSEGTVNFPQVRSDAYLLNVTQPLDYGTVHNARIRARGGGVMFPDNNQPQRFAIANPASLKSVEIVRRAERFTLLDESRQGDYLIIAHHAMTGGLAPFVELKKEQGFTPLVVSVDEIFDQFGYGEKSDAAIHHYLRYALENWRQTPLQWVMLVGEASDYAVAEECAVDKNIQIDHVPTFGFGRPFDRVKADSGYALMDTGDMIPDVVISRMPVPSPDMVESAFAKLIDFQRAANQSPHLYRSMFLCDDEREFEEILDQMIANVIPPSVEPIRVYQREFPYEYYYRVFMRRQSPIATNRIIQGINSGLHTLLFFGHGGPNIWTGERLLHIRDLDLLTNRDKLTFIVAATCNASWLDFPIEPGRHALGERLVTLPGGGAYAMFAPTTGTTPSEHEFLMTYLYDAVFKRQIPSVGAAMIYGKSYYALTRKNSFVLDQYIITGDASWGVPPLRPEPLPLNVVPTTVNYYERAAIQAKGEMPNMKWGSVAIHLTWPNGESRTIEQKHPIFNGTIDYTLNMPADAPEGEYILTVQGVDSRSGETVVASQPISIVKPRVKAQIVVLPMLPVFDANQEIITRLSLENESGVPLSNVTFRVSMDDQVLREGQVNLPANDVIHADATIKTQPGARELTAVAEYMQDGKRVEVAKASQVIVAAFPDGGARIYCRTDDVELVPESVKPEQAPQVKVRIRNLGRQSINDLFVEIRNADNQILSKPALLPLLPERGTKDVIVDFRDPMAIGEHPISVMISRGQPRDGQTLDPLILRTVTNTLRIVTGPDLAIVPGSLEFSSQEFLVGQTVNIKGTVTNRGYSKSKMVHIRAYRNKMNVPEFLLKPEFLAQEVTIPVLDPGVSHDFTIRWDNNNYTGRQNVIVVADPEQLGGESYWDNNSAQKLIIIKSPANFTLRSDLTMHDPAIISRRSEVAVTAVVENTGMWPSESATFEVIEQGVTGESRSLIPEQMLPPLQPGEQVEKEFSWTVDERFPSIEIVVNRLRDAAENNHADNSHIIAPLFVNSLESLAKADGENGRPAYDMTGSLAWGRFDRMYRNPENALIFVGKAGGSKAHSILFTEEAIVNTEAFSNDGELEELNSDNFWQIRDNVLEAGPDESPVPVRLALTLPEELEPGFYDVFVVAHSAADYLDYPASFAEIRSGSSEGFRPFDMSASPKPWGFDRMWLGRYSILDGVFDLEVRKEKKGVWTRLLRLEFEPYRAQYTSPVYTIKKPWLGRQTGSFTLTGDNFGGNTMELLVRCGDELEPRQIVWTPWTPLPWRSSGQSANFPVEGRYLQFQLRLNPPPSKEPIVRSVHFNLN